MLPHGIHVCIHCAQIHRHIGRHISQVKAINTGTYLWMPDEIAAMTLMGNRNAACLYSSGAGARVPEPNRDAPRAEREAHVRDKYERRGWFDAMFGPTSQRLGRLKHIGMPQAPRTSEWATR